MTSSRRVQYHRITHGWGCKGPPGIIWSNPPAQVRPPKDTCPGPCPDAFWLSLRGRLDNLPGQPVPVLSHPHSNMEIAQLILEKYILALWPKDPFCFQRLFRPTRQLWWSFLWWVGLIPNIHWDFGSAGVKLVSRHLYLANRVKLLSCIACPLLLLCKTP